MRILAYPSNAGAPARWSVGSTPILALGGNGGTGASEFARIALVARLSDGRILVVNGTSNEIRYFAPGGAFMFASGRVGRGPGEFDFVLEAIRSGDSVVVTDRSMRTQVIGPAGKLVRNVPRRGRPFPLGGVFPDGRVLLQSLDPRGDTTGARLVTTVGLTVGGRESGDPAPFVHMPFYEMRRTPTGISPVLLGPALRVATTASRACIGYAEQWEIRCYGQHGRLLSITRRALRPVPLPDATKEQWREAYRQQLKAQGGMPPDRLEASVRHFLFAEFQSAFGRFLAGPDGELWVSDFQPTEDMARQLNASPTPAGTATWSVLGAEGRWIADVRLPPRFALMDVGRDYVAGIDKDEDDVERVVVFKLTRR